MIYETYGKRGELIFQRRICKMVPKADMNDHFMSQWKQSKNINREIIMMIW